MESRSIRHLAWLTLLAAGIAAADAGVALKRPGSITASEGTTVTFTVLRSGDTAAALSVDYATQDGRALAGSDYVAAAGTLSWAPGDAAPKTFAVPIIADGVGEFDDEVFRVRLTNAVGGTLGRARAKVTIDDDDPAVRFREPFVAQTAEGGTATLTVDRFGDAGSALSVEYTTVDNVARSGRDFPLTAGTLSWAAGDTTPRTINVPIATDAVHETTELYRVQLANPAGGTILEPPLVNRTIGDVGPWGAARFERVFPHLSFELPVYITAAPGDPSRLYVVEQTGRIKVIDVGPDPLEAEVFLDLSSQVAIDHEEGLLGLVFAPDFATSRQFYVYYSVKPGLRRTRLSRFVAPDPARATRGSETILTEILQPFHNHKGGSMHFGPDGKLYLSTGDGGSGNDTQNNAQNLGVRLGKILRLNPDGTAPEDNPFTGEGQRREIWAYGLRNPWRTGFDRLTGELWVGDVGQNAREEIDIIVRGGNYGWRIYEGTRSNFNPDNLPLSDFAAPLYEYPHDGGRHCAVMGGFVYRGSAVPLAYGRYVFGDYCASEISLLDRNGGSATAVLIDETVENPAGFGEDNAGEIYAVSLEGGIYRMQ